MQSGTAAPFIDEIVQPQEAPDAGVKVQVSESVPLVYAPHGNARWGLFMFPSLWRLRDGRLVCTVTIGNDEMPSDADYHYLWYTSEDGGQRWTHAVPSEEEAIAWLRERFTLANGDQVYYEPKIVDVDCIGAEPTRCSFEEHKGICVYYRVGDVPDECRSLAFYRRSGGEQNWQRTTANMDPDILVPAFKEAVLSDDSQCRPTHNVVATPLRATVRVLGDKRLPALGRSGHDRCGHPYSIQETDIAGVNIHDASWGASPEDLDPKRRSPDVAVRLQIPMPSSLRLHDQHCRPILEHASGDLLCTSFAPPSPADGFRVIKPAVGLDTQTWPNIFRSTDSGRTWDYYSSVRFGSVGEYRVSQAHISAQMPAGNWLALLRTSGAIGTHGNPLCVTRSYDDGHTWSEPVAIRPGNVNPVGGILPNGVAFRMYGRPGQFVTFCADGEGKQWGNDITMVPAGKGDPGIEQFRNSCCNSCTYVTDTDQFLIAYTHYTYEHTSGVRPAVLVCQVSARPGGRQ